MRTKLSLLSIIAGGLVLLALAPDVLAQSSITNPLGNATICSLIKGFLNAIMIIGAPIAILFVIWAGANFVLARGKPAEIGKAAENLKWTLIGIAIFFGAIVITQVIFTTVSTFLQGNGQTQALNCTL